MTASTSTSSISYAFTLLKSTLRFFCWMKASKKTKSLSNPAAIKEMKRQNGPHTSTLQENGYDLPSHDALAQILPNDHHFSKAAKPELHRAAKQEQERPAESPEATQANKPDINHTYQVHQPHKRPPLHDFKDGPNMEEITHLQTKEVENYRSALSRMAEDIIALRRQVMTLEAENSQLRINLSLHQDLGRDLLHDTDIDVMTKAEIADRIASLKFKLASETSKAVSQRDRIQQLQNSLIKVIEKMERALDDKLRENDRRTGDKRMAVKKQRGETDHRKEEVVSALAAENSRLRAELDRTRQQPAPVIIQQPAQTKDTLPFKERLSLLNKLEKAEARVQTLEAQLEENSKSWGRQKQEMLTKLSEHRHGFVRTSTTILHNVPSRSVSESLYQKSRQEAEGHKITRK
ncbi:coiled-coil domain-containing protein 33 isoform X4 [Sparus aurata]|uniref:coiled-coil domain-containing protein 33 isoform X4 n=1 Tax=Sparus aurata TaxID=8175 RepID=UPI0011C147CC|nr:coiled-coil domain-containing protein 33 isoform X4 [Sparus aurata]